MLKWTLTYGDIIPFSISNYYVLRLVIHPILMNILLFITKRVAQTFPRVIAYTEYIAVAATFFLNSMFGRILLDRNNNISQMVLGSFIASLEQFVFRCASPFVQDAYSKYISKTSDDLIKRESILCQAFTAENLVEVAGMFLLNSLWFLFCFLL
jgi:hypothetical protein